MNFEEMLNKQEKKIEERHKTACIQKADKGATLFNLIEMVDILVKLTMKNVDFVPEERKSHSLDLMKNIDKPIITYKVVSRKTKGEKKPRIREEFVDTTDKGRKVVGSIYGQKFACHVQFNIISSVYSEAEEVMNSFEEMMFKYTGFFKKNGIAEIFFNDHLSDESYENLRESFSIRNIAYYVEVEKLIPVFQEEIEEIELLAQRKLEDKEEENL